MHNLRRLTPLVAATALFAAGCGGTTAKPAAGASSIVPASAPAYLAIDSNPASPQWRTIDALASKFPDKQKALDEIESSMSKEDVSWAKDVKPALGDEVDFVWLDFENHGRNFVMLTQPKNTAKFKQLVAKASKEEKVVYDKFRGFAVLASKQETIDRFKQESDSRSSSLADDKAFKDSMHRLGESSVVRAFVNGKVVMDLARKYGGGQLQPFIDKLGTLDWVALRFGATAQGIGLDTIAHGTPGSLFKSASNLPSVSPKLLATVPADALVSLSFHGSKDMFGGLQPALTSPQFRQFTQPLRQLGRILDGENVLYARPGVAGSRVPEVTLISTPSTDGTSILDGMVKRFAGSGPEAQTVDGTPVHALASNGLGLYYGNVDGKFVVTDLPSGIRAAKGSGGSLSESPDFKDTKAASGLPDKTWGLLYVNISSSIPYGEELAHAHIPAAIARNLKPLRSAVEYAASRTHEVQVSFFLRIK